MMLLFKQCKPWTTRIVLRPNAAYYASTRSSQCKFTAEHEWVRVESSNLATIGITDVAQKALGDIVYVELPKVGQKVQQKDPIGVVESVKGASDIFSPISGTMIAVNHEVEKKPSLINKEPYHAGWLCQLQMDQPEQYEKLMDEAAYQHFCKNNPQH